MSRLLIYYRQEEVIFFWLCTIVWLLESPNETKYQSHAKKASLGHQYRTKSRQPRNVQCVIIIGSADVRLRDCR